MFALFSPRNSENAKKRKNPNYAQHFAASTCAFEFGLPQLPATCSRQCASRRRFINFPVKRSFCRQSPDTVRSAFPVPPFINALHFTQEIKSRDRLTAPEQDLKHPSPPI
jgi:hypothetical protein